MEYVARGNLFRLIHDPAESGYRCNTQTCNGRQSRGIAATHRRATCDGHEASMRHASGNVSTQHATDIHHSLPCAEKAKLVGSTRIHQSSISLLVFFVSSFLRLFASADSSCVRLFSRRELVWAVTKRMLLSAAYGSAPCITDTRLCFLPLCLARMRCM